MVIIQVPITSKTHNVGTKSKRHMLKGSMKVHHRILLIHPSHNMSMLMLGYGIMLQAINIIFRTNVREGFCVDDTTCQVWEVVILTKGK